MAAPTGSIRFNTDSKKLEVYILGPVGYGTLPNGTWMEVDSWSPELLTGGTRVLFGGGYTPSATKTIDFANIETTGNFTDFGDLTDTHNQSKGSTASRTRAVWVGGGEEPSTQTTSGERVQIASTGNSTQFSNALSVSRRSVAGVCNGTRAIFAGGRTPTEQNVIDYMEISALTASVDFGDISRSDTYLYHQNQQKQ